MGARGAGLRKIGSLLERTMLVTHALFCYSFVILSNANEQWVVF